MADLIEREPTRDLVAGLISDARHLAAGHLGLMRGEFKDEFNNLKRVMTRIAAAVGVLAVAAVLAGHALAQGLAALGMPLWAGYLVATVVLLAVGGALLQLLPVDRKDSDLYPEESIANARRDLHEISQALRR